MVGIAWCVVVVVIRNSTAHWTKWQVLSDMAALVAIHCVEVVIREGEGKLRIEDGHVIGAVELSQTQRKELRATRWQRGAS
jgi:hypothetical protein